MRILILLILFLELNKAIIVFKDKDHIKTISLGEYNSKSKLKVYKNEKIAFVETKGLTQSDQYNTKQFIDFLDKSKLEFKLLVKSGLEIKLYREQLYLQNKDEKKSQRLDVDFYYYKGNSIGFYLAFKSKNNEIYGFISYNYGVVPYEYSINLKTKNKILSAPLSIQFHKE